MASTERFFVQTYGFQPKTVEVQPSSASLYNVNSSGPNLSTQQHICSLWFPLTYSCIHVFIRTWRVALPFSPYNDERMHFHSGMEIITDPMKIQTHICCLFFCLFFCGELEIESRGRDGNCRAKGQIQPVFYTCHKNTKLTNHNPLRCPGNFFFYE